MNTRTLPVACVGLLAAMTIATTSAPASVSTERAACGTVPGPAWTVPALSEKGSTYRVTAVHVTCAFASKWSAKLVRTPNRGEAGTHLLAPPGWSCLPVLPDTVGTRGTPGGCSKGGARFDWEIAAPRS